MKQVSFVSDYSPETKLTVVKTDDGDIVLKIRGSGEMRIATSGGKLHGEDLVAVCDAFKTIMDIFEKNV